MNFEDKLLLSKFFLTKSVTHSCWSKNVPWETLN